MTQKTLKQLSTKLTTQFSATGWTVPTITQNLSSLKDALTTAISNIGSNTCTTNQLVAAPTKMTLKELANYIQKVPSKTTVNTTTICACNSRTITDPITVTSCSNNVYSYTCPAHSETYIANCRCYAEVVGSYEPAPVCPAVGVAASELQHNPVYPYGTNVVCQCNNDIISYYAEDTDGGCASQIYSCTAQVYTSSSVACTANGTCSIHVGIISSPCGANVLYSNCPNFGES